MWKVAAIGAVLAAAVWAAAAGAAHVKATMTSSSGKETVRFENNDSSAYTQFMVASTDSPKITGATGAECLVSSKLYTTGGKRHTDYAARCRKDLGPGKSFDLTVTTKGAGRLEAYVLVDGSFTPVKS